MDTQQITPETIGFIFGLIGVGYMLLVVSANSNARRAKRRSRIGKDWGAP